MAASQFGLLLLIGGVCGLRWADRLNADNAPIHICSGHNIQLLWNFTLQKGERLKGMVWGCQPEGGEEGVMATYVDNHFVPMASFSGRLAHLQGAGIEVSCATILESGNYSVAVSTEGADNALTVHHKTVNVLVLDPPKTQNGELHVTQKEEAVRDVTTGSWHVQLSCGNFSDRGQPAIDVIWTTPSGQRLDSSSYEDGFFHLLLPNPVEGGNYSCSIPPAQTAVSCMDKDSPLLEAASVGVDEVSARFSLMEARQLELMERLTAERDSWSVAVDSVANRTEGLEQRLDEAVRNSAVPISFHTRLTSDTYLETGENLELDIVNTNKGDGYDSSTGRFTAPVDGTYFFAATTGSYRDSKYSQMQMMKEGHAVAEIKLYRRSNSHNMGTCHAVVFLHAGERVWLEASYDSYLKSGITSFSGFRI